MTATSSRFRMRLAVTTTALVLPLLAACGGNFNAQTNQVYTPGDGENFRDGTMEVLHAVVVSDTPGTGRLIAGLANGNDEQDDTLTGVRGEGETQEVTFSLEGGETTIPAGGLLQLADPESANIVVEGDPETVRPGAYIRLAISFQNGDEARLNVPVLEPGEDYADVELPEGGSSGETPTESPSPTTSPDTEEE